MDIIVFYFDQFLFFVGFGFKVLVSVIVLNVSVVESLDYGFFMLGVVKKEKEKGLCLMYSLEFGSL